ncbi:TRAP transporter small permease subunit [Roseovarius amoyensis]|uniref:TRAP transporter small permease subunit n=1 Tax=Roseovarius amoyensis TaxID=2211448 RepID=UPI0013A6BB2B|nr:TRAP transporter small permease subunit [Roseovarius amoyensis]
MLSILYRLTLAVNRFTRLLSCAVAWLVLAAVIISAGNAISRKTLNVASNAWLEAQWYLFGAVFLLGAAYALRTDAHVRIDIVSSRLNPRARTAIDVLLHCVFLVPFCLVMIGQSWPWFERSYAIGEMSSNAGGLVIWPAKLMIPIGFAVLLLQTVSEIISKGLDLAGWEPPS